MEPLTVRARRALGEVGVAVAEDAVTQEGEALQVTLEASAAADYDRQLWTQWALCFGTLGPLAGREVRIVNTIDGKPAVRVTASREAIEALAREELDTPTFLGNLKIEALLPAPQPLVADPAPPQYPRPPGPGKSVRAARPQPSVPRPPSAPRPMSGPRPSSGPRPTGERPW